jgi:hypothetical protein
LIQINASVRNAWNSVHERIREYLVAKEVTLYPPDAVDLLALALYHQGRADRSQHPVEQCEHQRVADIYRVLATINLPMSAFAELEGSSQNTTDNDTVVPGAVE